MDVACDPNQHSSRRAEHASLSLLAAATRESRPSERCEAWPRAGGLQVRAAWHSATMMPPQLSCTADWGNCQLLPAVGTIAHTKENCTKRLHCNRFDVCMALALVSALLSALVLALESAVVLESGAALVSAAALESVRRAEL